jgi:hypothetical protein
VLGRPYTLQGLLAFSLTVMNSPISRVADSNPYRYIHTQIYIY